MTNKVHAQAVAPPAAPCAPRRDTDSIRPYTEDASGFTGSAEAVFAPNGEAQVAALLREAQRAGTPVTTSGSGTGLTGGRVAQGGWVISTERLNHILEIAPGRARVQPGVRLRELQAAAVDNKQFYPPDPTEIDASLGGTVACNSSGSRSFKYGSTRRWVRRLRIVLPNGDLLDLSRGQAAADGDGRFEIALSDGSVSEIHLPHAEMPRTTKHSAGYFFKPGMDLIDLFIGAEGTLGVVTEIEVALVPWPGDVLGGVIFFRNDRDTLDFVERVRRLSRESNWEGPVHARLIEYFDANSLDFLRRHKYPEVPAAARGAVLLEQEIGSGTREEAAERWLDVVGQGEALLDESWFAVSPVEREKFREFRHSMSLIMVETARRNGFPKVSTDQAVPIERMQDIIDYYRGQLEPAFGGHVPPQYTMYGHIGDGHLHVNMLPTNQEQFKRAKAMLTEFAEYAVRLGGTVGAEHGLGKIKTHFLRLQYPPEVIDQMFRIKLALDPRNVLNRGNLFGESALLKAV